MAIISNNMSSSLVVSIPWVLSPCLPPFHRNYIHKHFQHHKANHNNYSNSIITSCFTWHTGQGEIYRQSLSSESFSSQAISLNYMPWLNGHNLVVTCKLSISYIHTSINLRLYSNPIYSYLAQYMIYIYMYPVLEALMTTYTITHAKVPLSLFYSQFHSIVNSTWKATRFMTHLKKFSKKELVRVR